MQLEPVVEVLAKFMNKVLVTGKIVRAITLNHVGEKKTPFAEIWLEIEEVVQDKQKNWGVKSDQFRFEVWRSRARYASQELQKGEIVEVEARLCTGIHGLKLEIQEITRSL